MSTAKEVISIERPTMVSIAIPEDDRSCFFSRINEWRGSLASNESMSGNNQAQAPKIQRVPQILRKIKSNEECYKPLVVSIGPYHYGNDELESMEKLKYLMACQYVMESRSSIADLYKKVEDVASQARKCYADEGSTARFGEEAFNQMMFLDGCFILQFIHSVKMNTDLRMKIHQVAYVQRDLLLLENQLPFLVLEALMILRFKKEEREPLLNDFIKRTRMLPDHHQSCGERIKDFISTWGVSSQDSATLLLEGDRRPLHLLDYFQKQLIDVNALRRGHRSIGDWSSYRSAMELKSAGIHFWPSNTPRFTDVKFQSLMFSGHLTLPPITVDDSTKSLLLNLVAYETCSDAPDDLGVTSYICFMDSLIDQAEDVKELRSKGVIHNVLGSDQQVADLFNEIANDLVPHPDAYIRVKDQIQKHYKSKIKVWIAEWCHTHFTTPWTVLAFTGAILALATSVIQTYFVILDEINGK